MGNKLPASRAARIIRSSPSASSRRKANLIMRIAILLMLTQKFPFPMSLAFTRFDTRVEDGKKSCSYRKSNPTCTSRQQKRGGYHSKEKNKKIADLRHKVRQLSDAAVQARNHAFRQEFGTPEFEAATAEATRLGQEVEAAGVEISELNQQQEIPNAPFKTTGEGGNVLKRLIRYAAEKNFDYIAWHGEPDSVAKTEGYQNYVSRETPEGKKFFSNNPDTHTATNLTSIFNRYLEKLPRIAKALGSKFDAVLEQVNPLFEHHSRRRCRRVHP